MKTQPITNTHIKLRQGKLVHTSFTKETEITKAFNGEEIITITTVVEKAKYTPLDYLRTRKSLIWNGEVISSLTTQHICRIAKLLEGYLYSGILSGIRVLVWRSLIHQELKVRAIQELIQEVTASTPWKLELQKK